MTGYHLQAACWTGTHTPWGRLLLSRWEGPGVLHEMCADAHGMCCMQCSRRPCYAGGP
jgi:hypothetical protein